MSRLSIIIPTLDEEANLPRLLESLRPLGPFDPEIILADGGSTDATAEIGRRWGACILSSERGRGKQLHRGACRASGHLLLFLHADSVLTPDAVEAIRLSLDDPGFRSSLFRLRFDSDQPIYRLYACFARFDSIWTTFGDQGLLIDRELYHRLGGFPPLSLFEDVIFFRKARRMEKIKKFRGEIITSSRRFRLVGPVRLQLRNLLFLTLYLMGKKPESLADRYLPVRTPPSDQGTG